MASRTDAQDFLETSPIQLASWIHGQMVPGEGTALSTTDPASPSYEVAVGHALATDQLAGAMSSARETQASWSSTSPHHRAHVMSTAADVLEDLSREFASTITREEGKPLGDSTAEVRRAVAVLRFYAQSHLVHGGNTYQSRRSSELLLSIREPVGVVAAITPWNFPLSIPVQKIAPALALGNTVVLKPSSLAPSAAVALGPVFHKAGLPAGALNVVLGDGSLGHEICQSADIDAITFTGSTSVGKSVAQTASAGLKRVQTEMGGKNALVILADSNPNDAADIAARGAFGLTGQSCTATGLILVESPLYDQFMHALRFVAQSMLVGSGRKSDVDLGPLISADSLADSQRIIREASQSGAGELVAPIDDKMLRSDGHFMSPTIIGNVRPGSQLATDELFSPIACVRKIDGLEDAIATVNGLEQGLAAGICTTSLESAMQFVEEVDAGIVKVNSPTNGLEIHLPFGGFKNSSSGGHKELGTDVLDFFTLLKTAYVRRSMSDSL